MNQFNPADGPLSPCHDCPIVKGKCAACLKKCEEQEIETPETIDAVVGVGDERNK